MTVTIHYQSPATDPLRKPRPHRFDLSGDNPILRAFATNPVGAADMLAALGGPGPVFDYASWESSSDESKHAANVDATDEQVAHARKVLAVIAKEENA